MPLEKRRQVFQFPLQILGGFSLSERFIENEIDPVACYVAFQMAGSVLRIKSKHVLHMFIPFVAVERWYQERWIRTRIDEDGMHCCVAIFEDRPGEIFVVFAVGAFGYGKFEFRGI
jgi:hypothetical protein